MNRPFLSSAVNNFIAVGKIAGIYGVKGWVKIISYTDPIENILSYNPWFLQQAQNWHEIACVQSKRYGKGLIAQLAGIQDREVARKLIGTEISIQRAQLPDLPEGEYYWADLISMTVINENNITLGQVIEVFATGANDVLVVKGEKRHLIPFLKNKTILNIDLIKKVILVAWDADFL